MRRVTWWGHATVEVAVGTTRILTDPVLRHRVAHLTRRANSPQSGDLEPSAILISHAHRDHLDEPTLRTLGGATTVVPRGAGRYVRGRGEVMEVVPGDEVTIGSVTVRAVPAVHAVRRGGRRIASLGFVIDRDIYFAGDTDLFDEMSELGSLEAALVPVWGWGTSLGSGHLDPGRAAQALARLRPRIAIPIHWGTYLPAYVSGGHSVLADPPREFARAAATTAPEVDVRVLAVGESLALADRL